MRAESLWRAGKLAGLAVVLAGVSLAQNASDDVAQLKEQVTQLQKQIDLLSRKLNELTDAKTAQQQPAVAAQASQDRVPVRPQPRAYPVESLTSSATPVAAAPAAPAPVPAAAPPRVPRAAPPQDASAPPTSPLQIRIGDVGITPVGFMDLTAFWRDKDAASSMGTNFGSVPYNNTPQGNLSESHFSSQNARIGFRVDGLFKGVRFIGYNEFDFNGTSGSTSLAVTNGSIVPRLRLYWVDLRKGPVEFLAGQSWSMMVPNRKGLSALPGDLFYSQVIDINYVAGFTWTRQPGMRILFHGPNDKVNFGLSVEQGDQYIGGSGGGGAITLPTALAGLVPAQLDQAANIGTGAAYLQAPTHTPDFIAKAAFDPSARLHFEVGGIVSTFKTASLGAPWTHHSTTGEGLTVGLNAGITKSVRAVATGMYSNGEGRYLFGAGPDLIVRADGSLSALRADSWITGLEATVKNTLLYAYYSGDYIGRNVAIDANGSLIGYGYRGSANSQNRSIQEVTFGFNQTIWKDAKYGAVNFMGQYEYLMRNPWYVAANAPKATHDNTVYINIRYTLPGSAPTMLPAK